MNNGPSTTHRVLIVLAWMSPLVVGLVSVATGILLYQKAGLHVLGQVVMSIGVALHIAGAALLGWGDHTGRLPRARRSKDPSYHWPDQDNA